VSYDLQVWSVDPVKLPGQLPEIDKWRRDGKGWVRSGASSPLSVYPSDAVLAEDIPEGVERSLPGMAFLTSLTLSPIGASGSALKTMGNLALTLAKHARGVVFDPQTDTLSTPRALSRVTSLGSAEAASLLTLSGWFKSGPLIQRDATQLLDALGACCRKRYRSVMASTNHHSIDTRLPGAITSSHSSG
jgi:hypothetical protein